MGTLANSVDPDEMQHNAAFHQGLHCLQRLKHPSGTEIHHYLEVLFMNSEQLDFLLNPFFVFRNLYVNLWYYLYTCCYTKMK